MSKLHLLRCCIIGEGSLPIQCAQQLLAQNHSVIGVISSDSQVLAWAEAQQIPHSTSQSDLVEFLSQRSFDYLFSITNPIVLSEAVLKLPQQLAINYHDSPLPRYAGLYASSWALLQREQQTAISWHIINPGIDDGNLLKQVPIEIAPNETALTLNAKCYEAAIAAFSELITELATGTVIQTPQDLSQRTYFSRSHKPQGGMQWHWRRSAQDLDALVRALTFGPFPNPLGLPKLLVNGQLAIVSKLAVLDQPSQQPAGTITAIAADAIQVATMTQDVRLQCLLDGHGQSIALADWVAQMGLQVGDCLPDLTLEQVQRLDQFDSKIAKQERFWVRQLEAVNPIALPDSLRLSQPTLVNQSAFAALEMALPEDAIAAMLSINSDWQPADVLMAAFVTYLSRISDRQQIDLGFSHSRLQQNFADLKNFFAMQVPCRIVLSPEDSFQQAIATVQTQVRQLKQRQTYTREIVARYPALMQRAELRLLTQPATRNPQNCCPQFPISVQQVEQWESGLLLPDRPSDAEFGAELTLLIALDGKRCAWVYNPAVLDARRVKSLADQFLTWVQTLLAQPQQRFSAVSLPRSSRLTPAERQQILHEWNDTAVAYPSDLRLHDLFTTQVEQAPDAIAVRFNGTSLTYRELNHRANQLASHLQALGVQPEVTVGICIERSLEMIVGLLAILKAGGAYVPLDPTYPADRLAHILADAQLAAVLTLEKFLPLLPDAGVPAVCLDADWAAIATESPLNPASSVTAEHLAYIIYTSGSTGKPKGVLIEHGGAVNTILDMNDRFQVGSADRVLAVCSLNFDLSVYDVFGLLAAGGTIVLPQPAIAPDLNHWIDLMAQEQVTLWNSAPPVMQMFAGHLVDRGRVLPNSLRLVLLSGDWIPLTLPDLIRKLKGANPLIDLISLGGATEASIWSILHPIGAIDPAWKSIPYGKPMANQQFYILDEQLEPIPVGEIGELFIGGAGVARGYHNRPELNATKFLVNPFGTQPPARLYRTGDLGRYLPDGTIEFLGRVDHQVKVRGFRVEMGEIEVVLTQHPAIRETAILARQTEAGNQQLVAYLVLHQQSGTDSKDLIEEIRTFLKAKLPDYMVPAAFVRLEALPLTPNGKLDRKALPAPNATHSLDSAATVPAPTDAIEQQLVQLWQEFLGVQPIRVTDNFFELGGQSLLAVRLWSQIEKTFNKSLPLVTLFQAPTIAQLADRLRQPGDAPLCPSLVVIQPGQPNSAKPPLFCIHVLGRGLQFFRPLLRHLDPDQTIYGLSVNIAGEILPCYRVESLAKHYIQQMRTLQPEGPYCLLGASFGGLVAFEIAQQLRAQGQTVKFLGLLDTRLPGAEVHLPVARQLSQHWHSFSRLGLRYLLKKLQAYGIGHTERLSKTLHDRYFQLRINFCQAIGKPLPETMQDFIYEHQNEQLGGAYQPQSYPDRITLFKASDTQRGVSMSLDATLGWGALAAGGVDVACIPGSHLGMLQEPNVRVLAEKLQTALSAAIVHRTEIVLAGSAQPAGKSERELATHS